MNPPVPLTANMAELVKRKALLVFADAVGLDLARRRLPRFLHQLFQLRALDGATADADIHFFAAAASQSCPGGTLHRQNGRTFAERLENAVEEIAALGYDEVVIVGRDCPRLSQSDITRAFAALHTRRLVLGPDHRGGCYLIGLRSAERGLLRGISWRRNTDCAQLRGRCHPSEVRLLSTKQDIDSWADVAFLAGSTFDHFAALAQFLLKFVCEAGDRSSALFVDIARHRVRVRGQMPPPAFVG